MQNKGHIKKLKRFLASGDGAHAKLKERFALSSDSAVFQWITRGALPKHKRAFILKFMREEMEK